MARRIISLLPSATEIVHALGLIDSLVGHCDECDYPPKLARWKDLLNTTRTIASCSPSVATSVPSRRRSFTVLSALAETRTPELQVHQALHDFAPNSLTV